MPGIFGFTLTDQNRAMAATVLAKMLELATHGPSYKHDPLFQDGSLCGGRTHTNIIQLHEQPYSDANVHVWLHGEFYNQEELSPQSNSNRSDASLLSALFRECQGFEFLRRIDGIYAAVIYDANRRQVHLLNDRYGLRHLFWRVNGRSLAWASEVKSMIGLQDFRPTVDPQAAKDLWSFGYLRDNRTWFRDVELLPPASVLTWNLDRESASHLTYWRMGETRICPERTDADMHARIHSLFLDAIRRRTADNLRMGVTLSGGLDSRLVFATLPKKCDPVATVTFGRQGSDDVRIACRVNKLRSSRSRFCAVSPSNWLPPRVEGVWWTDGMLDLTHMHSVHMLPALTSEMDVALGGFLGDAVIGGTYLTRPPLSEIENYNQPGRRFVGEGSVLQEVALPSRHPFMDNALFDYCLSINPEKRIHAKLYTAFLLKYFPEFYEDIESPKIGVPLRWLYPRPGIEEFTLPVRRRLAGILRYSKERLGWSGAYEQYWRWVTQPPARDFIERLLFQGTPMYPEYLDRNDVRSVWDRHIHPSKDSELPTEQLCRAMTAEIWLQQVFKGKRVWEHFQ